MEKIRILIVEDEKLIRWSLRQQLEKHGYRVSEAENGAEARKSFTSESWDLVLLDIKLPDANGLDLLREISEGDPELPVIMMTAYSSVESVVNAMKRGAFDYITKPFNLEEVVHTVQKALEVTTLRREVRAIKAGFESRFGFEKVIGKSEKMLQVMEIAKTVAESEAETVLIAGESGTGKNLLAQAIHYNSQRAGKPFMEVTCTALPEQLLESELFGHERGAFTDARNMKVGLCELAHNGTLFLDEIGDMPLATQAKLLGFCESRTFRRVGGVKIISVNLRVVAATNQDMLTLIEEKRFREDLYYRLNVIEIVIPPLRERPEDIVLLANFFVDRFNHKFKKKVLGIDDAAMRSLTSYPWPGNVRELKNVLERAMILTRKEVLEPGDFFLKPRAGNSETAGRPIELPPEGISLEEVERELVRQALESTKGNQTNAARLLHISRDQLRYRMKQYDLFDA